MTSVPWMEAYRPTNFENIVLDPLNKKILKNIIDNLYFPNLLFYGPPGTGKTTTIINLINAYQEKVNIKNKDLIIHLNASDERGVDIIRNQINSFVNSKPLFNSGMKFVILDEVDYMTKNAQQALRYLLQNYSNNVRFCLICNYISKIDDGLQNEFLKLCFKQLPSDNIINFLKNISDTEQLNFSYDSLKSIQQLYKSDIRSMINFMQSNQDNFKKQLDVNIIDNAAWDNLLELIKKKENIESIYKNIQSISIKYNIDKKNIIKDFLNYIIRNHSNITNTVFYNFVENLMHSCVQNNNLNVNYSIARLSTIILQLEL
jgi:replication factor C subunit 3/5